MELSELKQLYYLNREIMMTKRRLTELENAATGTARHITGLPHIKAVLDRPALAAQIADARLILEGQKIRCMAEYNRLNQFIAEVDDSLTRQVLALRFVNGLSWRQVAFHVGGGNTECSVRQLVSRFLKNN